MQKTINSVLKQKNPPFYHVFVDLNSIDKTRKLINNYSKNTKNIKVIVINQINKGIYKAWNQGLIWLLQNIDKNHFISILNSDDWLSDDYIQKIGIFKEYDLIAGSGLVYYENEQFIRPCRSLKLLPVFMPIIDPSLIVKASVYRKIGLYRERYKVAADHDFVYRAYDMGYEFKILNDTLVNIKMGGFAYKNRKKAFIEQLELSRERCLFPLPEFAYLYRLFKFPRLRFFDFL